MNIVGTKARSPAALVQAGRALTLERVADGAEGLVLADLARAVAAEPNAPATSLLVVCRDGPRLATCCDGGAAHDGAVAPCPPQAPSLPPAASGGGEGGPAFGVAHHSQCRGPAGAGTRRARQGGTVGRAGQYAGDGRHYRLA